MATGTVGTAAPQLYRWHVARPRLTRVIERSSARVVLLFAPAGYGKTTVAREWVVGKRHVWYRPTAASADVAAFAVELAQAAEAIVPGAGARLAARLREGPVDATAAAELLAAELSGWPPEAWLVVDDYDQADSPAVAELLDRVLEVTPLRLVATTRTRPAWATARRQVYGELVELTDGQLAMTTLEAARVLGVRASETAQQLVDHAGGWPALVGLAAIASSVQLPPGRMADALYRYLASEVLEQRPADEKRFMLLAAVPFMIDAATAAGPLGCADGEHPVEALAADSILHETGAGAYRFHPLLRDFLRRRLLTEDPGLFVRLAGKLAAAARDDERWEEAFELALDAGDVDLAAAVVGVSFPSLFEQGRFETVERWVARCGQVRGDAALELARAELAIVRADAGRAESSLVELAHAVGDEHHLAPRVWRSLANAYDQLSRHTDSLDSALRAAELARDSPERADALYLAVRAAGDSRPELLPSLVAALEAEPRTLDVQVVLAMARVWEGIHCRVDLSGQRAVFEELVTTTAVLRPSRRRLVLVGAAYLALSRGAYRRSREIGRLAIALAEEFHFDRLVLAMRHLDVANACTGMREFRASERALEQAVRAAGTDVPWFAWEHGNARAKLQLARGELEAVLEREAAASSLSAHRVAERAGLRAIAAAALGRRSRAREEIAAARAASSAIEASFYTRFAEAIVDESRVAAVVADAFARDFHDACTIAYRAHPPLLAAAAAEPELRPELTRLVLAANDRMLGCAAGLLPKAELEQTPSPLLTPREAQVLRLLEEGLSNREIAARLVIARSTAKLHVHHILAKFGVSSRTQVVVAARRQNPA